MKQRLEISCTNEFVAGPSAAFVEITPVLAARILKLSRIINRVDASYISFSDNSPEFYANDPEHSGEFIDDEFEIKESVLVVERTTFHWAGHLKNPNNRWQSTALSIKEIETIAMETPQQVTARSLLREIVEAFPPANPETAEYNTGINGADAVDFICDYIPRVTAYLKQTAP